MRIFGLIGNPLDHSWSKSYFEGKFRKENIPDCLYENFPLSDVSVLREFITTNRNIAGLNVTIPYKIEVMDYLDSVDEDARAIRAVNCIRISEQEGHIFLEGFNTDFPAFLNTLKPILHPGVKRALVLGTGGGARAVAHALKELSVEYDTVSRVPGRGGFTYDEITPEALWSHELIINATPAGMKGFPGDCPPLPYDGLGTHHILYDLVYNPEETIFLSKGKAKGSRVKNGLEMLIHQAELSWKAWHSL